MSPGRDRPTQASSGLSEVIGRALADEQFRESLFQDRNSALRGFHLTDTDMVALDNLSREQLEQHAARFEQGSETAVRVDVAIKGTF